MSDEGLRARAQKIYVEWVDDDDDGRSYWEVMADFAQQIREDDCMAVCELCRNLNRYVFKEATNSIPEEEIHLSWIHWAEDGSYYKECEAAAIRNLAEKEKQL